MVCQLIRYGHRGLRPKLSLICSSFSCLAASAKCRGRNPDQIPPSPSVRNPHARAEGSARFITARDTPWYFQILCTCSLSVPSVLSAARFDTALRTWTTTDRQGHTGIFTRKVAKRCPLPVRIVDPNQVVVWKKNCGYPPVVPSLIEG